MSEIISKELLSEITKRNIHRVETSIDDYSIPENQVKYWCETTVVPFYINIHELAHKCKEWAIKNNREDARNNSGNHFYINHIDSSHIGVFEHYQCCVGYRGLDKDGDWSDIQKCFSGKGMTEPEAIFKACQWILDNKD